MGRFGQHVYPALEPERPIGAADNFGCAVRSFARDGLPDVGRGSVHGQVGTMLDQIQQYRVGARVGLPPYPVRAGPAEGPKPANSGLDFAGSVTTDRFSRSRGRRAPPKLCVSARQSAGRCASTRRFVFLYRTPSTVPSLNSIRRPQVVIGGRPQPAAGVTERRRRDVWRPHRRAAAGLVRQAGMVTRPSLRVGRHVKARCRSFLPDPALARR